MSNQPFILIVDDNPTNLAVLSQALKTAGYKVRMAIDGQDALAQVDRAHPELILLDVQMPNMDGFEACRCLKSNPNTATIPVIFMTALADTDHKVKGLSIGAVDYITKPFEQEEVLARVKIHWRLKQLTDSLEAQIMERSIALQQAQVQLVQQEKLSTLGQLIAGIGHEINNPLGHIASNIAPAKQYLTEFTEFFKLYQQHHPQPVSEIADYLEEIDLAFTLADFSNLLDSMNVASDRMRDISESLRNFARSDSQGTATVDLHEGLESTLLLLKHRLKANGDRPEIKIVKDYGDLPQIQCYAGQLNQVFMNLLANAIDALEGITNPQISIVTRIDANQIKISISDNGIGMSEAVAAHIFDHAFTTKEIGKGTGLGLAIVQQIIEKHQGSIEVNSEPDKGAEFLITLPV